MPRSAVLGFASKLRMLYRDDEAADEVERLAAGRKDWEPPAVEFFCYECGGSNCEHAPQAAAPTFLPDEVTFRIVDGPAGETPPDKPSRKRRRVP
jgi:hypothetical protein